MYPWQQPCSIARPHPTNRGTLLELVDDQSRSRAVLEELQTSLRDSKENASALKIEIKMQLANRHLRRECNTALSLTGMPQTRTSQLFVTERHDTLSSDFRRLAILSVFLQQAHQDSHSQEYDRFLLSLQEQILSSMCYIELLTVHPQALSYSVTPAVMPDYYRNLTDQALRDRRNCLMARDISRIIEDMLQRYSSMS